MPTMMMMMLMMMITIHHLACQPRLLKTLHGVHAVPFWGDPRGYLAMDLLGFVIAGPPVTPRKERQP
jgi:hypothetical protein